MKKILAISSPGGHWIQLNRICQLLEKKHHVIYAVPNSLYNSKNNKNIYSIIDVNADNKLKLIPCSLQVLYILLKEKPDTILSTGAAPGAVAMVLGHFLRKQTIWIDSIANIKRISRSGKLCKPYADVFLTQWQHLAEADSSNIQYHGSVL